MVRVTRSLKGIEDSLLLLLEGGFYKQYPYYALCVFSISKLAVEY